MKSNRQQGEGPVGRMVNRRDREAQVKWRRLHVDDDDDSS